MTLPKHEFDVRLQRGRESLRDVVPAETPHLAVVAAELRNEGYRAVEVEVLVQRRVAGRCVSCGVVLFDDDDPQTRGAGVSCRDCNTTGRGGD